MTTNMTLIAVAFWKKRKVCIVCTFCRIRLGRNEKSDFLNSRTLCRIHKIRQKALKFRGVREAIILKKIYFAKKFHKRGEGVIWISYLYFFIVNAPKYSPPKKINFHKTPTGGRGHRFMKLFRKIDFF